VLDKQPGTKELTIEPSATRHRAFSCLTALRVTLVNLRPATTAERAFPKMEEEKPAAERKTAFRSPAMNLREP
jgi:hypothetical protein